jgi:putative FmdB family regulatory protein
MTIYAYKCRTCGEYFDSQSRSLTSCPRCLGRDLGRDYSTVQLSVGAFRPHYNHAVGAYVSSSQHFDDLLKVRAEEAGTTFVRTDPGDVPRPTVDDQAFDTQARTIRDRNINPKDLT